MAIRKPILTAVAAMILCSGAAERELEPEVRTVGSLDYSREAMEYFAPFVEHKAALMTGLPAKNNFDCDAPVDYMLRLSQPPGLKMAVAYPDELIRRAGNEEILTAYRKAIKKFARKSDFNKSWEGRLPLYNKILDKSATELKGMDFVATLEDYIGMTQGSTILSSPCRSTAATV